MCPMYVDRNEYVDICNVCKVGDISTFYVDMDSMDREAINFNICEQCTDKLMRKLIAVKLGVDDA